MDGNTNNADLEENLPKVRIVRVPCFMYSPYNRFRASLITFSTGAAGSSFSMAATTLPRTNKTAIRLAGKQDLLIIPRING